MIMNMKKEVGEEGTVVERVRKPTRIASDRVEIRVRRDIDD